MMRKIQLNKPENNLFKKKCRTEDVKGDDCDGWSCVCGVCVLVDH